jgi:hypothetical protein
MDHLRIDEPFVFVKPHTDCLVVRAGIQLDLAISREVFVAIRRRIEDVSKGCIAPGL